ncbi:MAG: hypothetical protein H8D45_07490, partial [Bacteroidetes bacterium]|nr:hypothetical protein [Bacteroidota bacterium]
MKLFTKLGFALLVMLISSSVLWAQSSARDIGPKKQTYTIASEALFDLQFEWPVGVGGGEAGIECDGINIYTTKWNGADFYRYQLDGTYIESFTISGASNVRDLAFNGTYFYGGAASTTVFEMDFSAQSLVSSFTAPTECRAIGYNEDDDVFYANNWGSAITVFDPAGTFVSSWSVGPTGDSYYGFAYDNYSTGAPYLWGYAQVGATLNELIQMQLPDGAETGVYFDVGSVVAVGTGIAGGMAIDDNLFTGYWTILGTSQNVNIWGLELCPSGAQPTNDVGVMAIVEPSSGVNLTASEPVIVKIKNYGTAAQSNFDVSFTLDAGTPVVETVTATINSGDTYDHTFATTVDLSDYGTYTFEACTDLTGDENPGNDCNTKVVENSTAALCVPVYTTGCTYGDGFTDFALEEIENYGSGCADLNGTGWSQYLGLGPASLEAGNTYDVIMASGYNNNFTSIWIDFNDDLDLTPDEMVLNNFEMVTAGILYTVPIDIPAGVPDGQHIMRARTNWNATCDDPCTSYSYGEAEDYYVVTGGGVVLDPPTDLTATFVPDDDIYLDWVAPGGGPTGSILCVDRDGSVDLGFTDDWPAIQAALDANALTYDYHEVTDLTQDGPDLATMQQYDLIIWFTGESWQNNQTMSNNDEANLGTFIAGGGNLLLSAQDYFYDRYSSAGSFSAGQFPYDYLGVASTTQDNWSIMAPDVADISGVAGSFADGITFQVQDIYTTDKEGLYIDQIVSMDQDLFEVTNPTPAGIAACQYDGGSFRTAFTTISLAAVTDAGILATVMGNAVSWLSGGDSDA